MSTSQPTPVQTSNAQSTEGSTSPQWVLRPFAEGKEVLQQWSAQLQLAMPAITPENYAQIAPLLVQKVATQDPAIATEIAKSLLVPAPVEPSLNKAPAGSLSAPSANPSNSGAQGTATAPANAQVDAQTKPQAVAPSAGVDPWQATQLHSGAAGGGASQMPLAQAQAMSTWPLYHLLRQKGGLAPEQGIHNHQEACEKLAQVLKATPKEQREAVLLKLVNPYGLNYGQPALQALNERYATDSEFKYQVDQHRLRSGLTPWPELTAQDRTALVQRFEASFQHGMAQPTAQSAPQPAVQPNIAAQGHEPRLVAL